MTPHRPHTIHEFDEQVSALAAAIPSIEGITTSEIPDIIADPVFPEGDPAIDATVAEGMADITKEIARVITDEGILAEAQAEAETLPDFLSRPAWAQRLAIQALVNARREHHGIDLPPVRKTAVIHRPYDQEKEDSDEARDDVYSELGGGRNTYYREGTLDPNANAEVIYEHKYVWSATEHRMVPGVELRLGDKKISVAINEGLPESVAAEDIARAEDALRRGHGSPIKKAKKN